MATTTTREKRIDLVRMFTEEVRRREEKYPGKVTGIKTVTGNTIIGEPA